MEKFPIPLFPYDLCVGVFSVVTQRPDPVCPSCKGGEQNLQIFPICHSNSDTGTDNGKEAAVCSGSELVTHSSYNT